MKYVTSSKFVIYVSKTLLQLIENVGLEQF